MTTAIVHMFSLKNSFGFVMGMWLLGAIAAAHAATSAVDSLMNAAQHPTMAKIQQIDVE